VLCSVAVQCSIAVCCSVTCGSSFFGPGSTWVSPGGAEVRFIVVQCFSVWQCDMGFITHSHKCIYRGISNVTVCVKKQVTPGATIRTWDACVSFESESAALEVCCSVLQCVAVCCSVLQCVVVCCIVLQCVAACCIVLQCVALHGTVLQCNAVCCSVLQCVAVCCSVLQSCAVCCSPLQYVAVQCRVL